MHPSTKWSAALCLPLAIFASGSVAAAQLSPQVLHGHVRPLTRKLAPLHQLAGTNRLDLSIALPLRNQDKLTNLLQELYQPGSTNFRRFLTPDEFAASFGPTPEDYQAVIGFARAHGFTVTKTHSNRTLVGIRGSVTNIEAAFHTHLRVYQHPKEARTFFAPDTEPSLDLSNRVLAISGLDNYVLPRPNIHPAVRPAVRPLNGSSGGGGTGSGQYGYYGQDFLTAYLPNTLAAGVLDGSGQAVALFELYGYNPDDITDYCFETGLPGVPLVNELIDNFDGDDSDLNYLGFAIEVTSDIEMAISMATNLSAVYVYEGAPPAAGATAVQDASVTAEINDIFNQIAVDNFAKQISCSYGMDINLATIQIFQQFAAQGQSLFQASGDNGAYSGAIAEPSDDPYLTVVGGTDLFTDSDGSWLDEMAWLTPPHEDPFFGEIPYGATGGGVSLAYPIPWWQQGISMASNQGSTTMRNVPDVAIISDGIDIVYGNTDLGGSTDLPLAGTSLAAPLWAAFTALVNQQAGINHQPPVGFLNPSLYAIGKSVNYVNCFNDIVEGSNVNSSSPTKFYAMSGYDLCTGWGTPTDALIDALLAPPSENLQVNPPFGFVSFGPPTGPFTTNSRTFTLTNIGASSLNWRLTNSANWLSVSATNGTLAAHASTTVTVGLNSTASNFLIASASGSATFANLTGGTWQDRQFDLYAGNGGFETGDLSNWTLVGNSTKTFVLAADDAQVAGTTPLSGVPDEPFIHSGLYAAYLGQSSGDAKFSHTVPTVPGQEYVVSFWLTSVPFHGSTTPNDFTAKWDGSVLFGRTNLPAIGWTNLQFLVPASANTTTLEFDYQDKPGALGLDDVSVAASPAALLKSAVTSQGNFKFSWTAFPGASYQILAATNLGNPNWTNANATLTTTNNQVNATIPAGNSPRQFYRVVVTNQ